ncbi:radical SAM/SPASM domain-containing protein [Thermoproteota archaeon]
MKRHNITLVSNGITFAFKNVPEKKYRNYVSMTTQEFDIKTFQTNGFPYKLQIEPTNTCNLSCPVCPVGSGKLGRKPKHMTLNEFKSIIDDMGKYLLLLGMWEWGEPFMNPELPAMIKYASKHGIKTITSTNAHFLHNERYVEAILKSGLTCLVVAIDSLDGEEYKVYRKRGSLTKALSGLENLIKMKKRLKSKTLINLRMVIMKQNEHELNKIRKTAKDIGADIFTVKTLNPACGLDSMNHGLVPSNQKYRRYEYRKGTREPIRIDNQCRKIWHMSHIFSNGDVVHCCYHYGGKQPLGNVTQTPFTKIWNSQPYRTMREQIYNHRTSLSVCNECVVNFKLSRGTYYPEVVYFNQGLFSRIEFFFITGLRKAYERSPFWRKILQKMKKIKYSF